MTVNFSVDCRDERIYDCSVWISPEDNTCGIVVSLDTVKLYLTESQVEEIALQWKAYKPAVKREMSHSFLSSLGVEYDTNTN